MQTADIALLACGISISLQFMSASPDPGEWTVPAARVAQFEEILAGISALLTLCGKPLYLMQTWNHWTMVANMVAKYHIYIRLDIEMYNIQREAITAGGE
jgi:hypothetical protein